MQIGRCLQGNPEILECVLAGGDTIQKQHARVPQGENEQIEEGADEVL
jgi:hypothetical protein